MRINHLPVRLIWSCLLLLVTLSSAGCRRERGGLLLYDRFGNPDSGWGKASTEAFDRGYQDGEYFIEVYEPNWLAWAAAGQRFTDVALDIEARPHSVSGDDHFGVLCRYRAPDSFYYFALTADGRYAILRVSEGRPTVLTGDGFLSSPAIPVDAEVYRLRAVCQGEDLALYVDGQPVAAASDDALRRGDVGLAVGSGPQGNARVHFDNLSVLAPEEGE